MSEYMEVELPDKSSGVRLVKVSRLLELRTSILTNRHIDCADALDAAACIMLAADTAIKPSVEFDEGDEWVADVPDEVPFLAYVVDVYDREYVTYANNVYIVGGMVEFRVEGELQSMFSVDSVRKVERCEEE